jgi:hypothetical protein
MMRFKLFNNVLTIMYLFENTYVVCLRSFQIHLEDLYFYIGHRGQLVCWEL